ncbi:class I SAM-dependent methyltransferase [Mumia sp. Pv 4-285]|uniref:class I SAM-dependent methyltransferase n=1 Tax=Mumia qirimensis TaxID=3234852 RepID=UPI00351CBEA8
MPVPGRIAAAVEALPLTPSSDVLEIGGGPGVAAQLVLERLGAGGSYLSVDRSAVSESRTRQRCADTGSEARWQVRRGAIEDVVTTLPSAALDVVFAVNVNAFWTGDASALTAELGRVLRPGGTLWLFFETPSGSVDGRVADGCSRSLRGGGLGGVTGFTAAPRLGGFTASRGRQGITNR